MTEQNKLATEAYVYEALGTSAVISIGVNSLQAMSIVAALTERGLINPLDVARWAESYATAAIQHPNEEARAAIKIAMISFAGSVRSMATKPAGSGETRQ